MPTTPIEAGPTGSITGSPWARRPDLCRENHERTELPRYMSAEYCVQEQPPISEANENEVTIEAVWPKWEIDGEGEVLCPTRCDAARRLRPTLAHRGAPPGPRVPWLVSIAVT